MKILKIIGIVLASLIALFLILGLFMSKDVTVERSTVINAPKAQVFDMVLNYKKSIAWNPWVEKDPNIKVTFSENDGVVGAYYSWTGNDKVGEGKQTITAIKDQDRVDSHINFEKPMKDEADSWMALTDTAGATKASWSLHFVIPYPWNAMALFTNMEAQIAPDFENGLKKLKAICEAEATTVTAGNYAVKEEDAPERVFAAIRGSIAFDQIPGFFEQNFVKVGDALKAKKIQASGAPTGLYFTYDQQQKKTDMAAGFLIAKHVELGGPIKNITLPAGKALTVDYYGAYDQSATAYAAIGEYAKAKNLKTGSPVLEVYITDPKAEKDTAKWLTKIYFPIEGAADKK